MSSHPEPSSKMTGKCCFVCSMNNYSVSRVKCRYLRMRKLVSLFEVQLFHRQMSTVRLAAMWDRRHPPPTTPRFGVPVVDAPVEAEVEGAQVAALPHHLHHRLVVELGNVSQVQDVQVPELQREEKKHTSVK